MRPLLLVLVLSVACSDEPDIPKPAHRGVDAPDQEAWDVTKKVTRNGRLRASIQAPHLRKYDRERISRLDGGVSVTFYGQRSGEVLSRLTSKKAEIDEGRRVLTAMDKFNGSAGKTFLNKVTFSVMLDLAGTVLANVYNGQST